MGKEAEKFQVSGQAFITHVPEKLFTQGKGIGLRKRRLGKLYLTGKKKEEEGVKYYFYRTLNMNFLFLFFFLATPPKWFLL